METNEKLKEQPIASVKAIMEYAEYRQEDLDYRSEEYNYWQQIEVDCLYELEVRIKQIFPL